jgi:hypothetical protein
LPSIAPDNKTKNVCSVIGTGVNARGIYTYAPSVVKIIKLMTPIKATAFLLETISFLGIAICIMDILRFNFRLADIIH